MNFNLLETNYLEGTVLENIFCGVRLYSTNLSSKCQPSNSLLSCFPCFSLASYFVA